MTTGNTTLLGLALPVQGELDGTWGDVVNQQITELLDTAVAGTTTLNTDADVTLTTTVLAANQARQAVLLWTANGTTTRNITAPAQSKAYIVINASAGTQSIVVRGAGPTTGVTIIKGERALVAWNGSDFVKIGSTSGAGTFTDLTVTGNTILGDAAGDTITVNGATTFVNVSPTITPGTANGVAYLNGSKVLTTGSALTFDGTNLSVPAEVYRTSATSYLRLSGGDGAGSGANVLAFGQSHASAPGRLVLSAVGTGDLINATINGAHLWQINSAEQMRLTSTGLGIGTSSPGFKLQVIGTSQMSLSAAGTQQALQLNNSDTTAGTQAVKLGFSSAGVTKASINAAVYGNDYMTFNVGSDTERMRLDSSGNLGIGTSSPGAKLEIAQSADNTDGPKLRIANNGNTLSNGQLIGGIDFYNGDDSGTGNAVGAYIYSYTNDATVPVSSQDMRFATGGTATRMTLDSSGNLGLGVTPSAWGDMKALQINSFGSAVAAWNTNRNTYILSNAYYDTSFKFSTTATASAVYYNASGETGVHSWHTAGAPASRTAGNAISFTQAMTLDASGNLGVGVTSVTAPGASRQGIQVASAAGGAVLLGQSATATNNARVLGANSGAELLLAGGAGNPVTIYTDGTERARITSGGDVGIGTSSPSERLDVYLNSTGNISAKVGNTSGSVQLLQSNGIAYLYTAANQPIAFSTNNTERMRLDSAGNLGLGVTPSAWTTVTPVFQMGRASFYGFSNEARMSANFFFNGADRYIANGFATSYNQADGAHRFFTAPSGTAGNAITFTQAMTLDSSGRLMVGYTSNTDGSALQINANSVGSTVYTAAFNNSSTSTSAYNAIRLAQGASGSAVGILGTGGSAVGNTAFQNTFGIGTQTTHALTFITADTERARITSGGDLLVGTTTANARLTLQQSGSQDVIRVNIGTGGSGYVVIGSGTTMGAAYFQTSSGFAGQITCSGTTTSYATSSDYRLKENIQPMTGALAKVQALKPCTYKWKADGSDGEGFIAHELAEVVPQCVTGEKDAVDEDGNPKYQGIDTSFLVATLTAAIQELKAEFDAYKATHP